MSVFNFMETFFFISLGITFILILLLVYHFKQRLGAIEQKGDTMFDIVNTMVREMSIIKSMVVSQMQDMSFPVNHNSPVFQPMNNEPVEMNTLEEVHPNVYHSENIMIQEEDDDKKIIVSDDDEDDEEDEDEDEDDDEDDDEDEDEDEEDEDDDNEVKPNLVKVINIPMTETDNSLEEIEDVSVEANTIEIEEVDMNESEPEEVMEEVMEAEEIKADVPVLVVRKLEESHVESDLAVLEKPSDEIVDPDFPKESKDSEPTNYGKLSLYTLKNLVVSKGLVKDAGKMKKPQLIQILEQADK